MDPTTLTMLVGAIVGGVYTFLHSKGVGLTPAPILPGIPANLGGIASEVLKAAATHRAGAVVNALADAGAAWLTAQGKGLAASLLTAVAHELAAKLDEQQKTPDAPK